VRELPAKDGGDWLSRLCWDFRNEIEIVEIKKTKAAPGHFHRAFCQRAG